MGEDILLMADGLSPQMRMVMSVNCETRRPGRHQSMPASTPRLCKSMYRGADSVAWSRKRGVVSQSQLLIL